MKKENCIVAQSGGPTAAINASLAGVIDGVKNPAASPVSTVLSTA